MWMIDGVHVFSEHTRLFAEPSLSASFPYDYILMLIISYFADGGPAILVEFPYFT